MHEAKERQEAAPKAPKQRITDPDELAEYKLRKRKEFEDRLRMQRMHMPSWMRYAEWEASHGEFTRARSVFERAIDVDYQNRTLWLKYAEMEMKNKFINRARNVWDRAVTILPRVDQYWYKYAYMEEMVGNINNARAVFERWMKWEPDDPAWLAYIKLEMRQGEVERARAIYERYVACAFTQQAYLRFAKWEDRQGQFALSRRVYERAIEDLPEDQKDEDLYISFAKFEEKCHEHERARAIFKFGLDKIPKELAQTLYKEFIAFEKKHGNREGIEDVILDKRRFQYEDAIKENSHNYDVWFDYIRLEEANSDPDKVRDVYERAIANVPPVAEKKYWRRYIYLWINYALYEELETKDFPRARDVYSNVLQLVPHESFTFSKLWILAANFEIRRRELAKARLILGKAIGMCPTEKVFKSYIHLELQLGNIDRCRILY
ncbi:CRNKL1, partial [Symbiodinium sp. KB8]